jgi:Uma2 family endonuclease
MKHQAASSRTVSFEDYFVGEESSDVRHEWHDGVVYAMSRGTPRHGRLIGQISRLLGNALEPGCALYTSDTPIWIEAANLCTYADASFVCGALQTMTARNSKGLAIGEAIVNPTIIVEVLSPTTERYDRDGKFAAYRLLASFSEYVLVAQDEPRIEVYRRTSIDPEARWACESAELGGQVTIHGSALSVDAIYSL